MIRVLAQSVLVWLALCGLWVLAAEIKARRRRALPLTVDFDALRAPLHHGVVIQPRVSRNPDGSINVRCSCAAEGAEVIAANRGLHPRHHEAST